jgi:3-phosphoglycerate kinase
VDKLILGGGMVFTFLKARGINVSDSMVEDDDNDNGDDNNDDDDDNDNN